MKTNYFFLLFFLLILMGCSDDKNIPDIPASTEDTYEGVHDLIPTGTLSNGKPSTGDYPGLPYSLWKKG